jgi:isovaleryl-CoA dehydrogenase
MDDTRARTTKQSACKPEDTELSFARQLFFGAVEEEEVFPYPDELGADERETLAALLDPLDRFLRERIDEGDIDHDTLLDPALLDELKQMGLFGLIIPTEYDGLGLSNTGYVRLFERIAATSASVAVTVGAHQSIGLKGILLFGTEEQKRRYLPPLALGEQVAAFCLTEPTSGSDAASIRTRATPSPDGEHWVLDGSKMWITNGPDAQVLIVYMRTADKSEGSRTMTAFLVEKGMPGFSTAQKLDKLGMRGSNTCELVFENCEIPAANVLGEVNLGVRVLMSGLNSERLVLSGGPIGLMQAAMDIVLPYVRERRQFDSPIGRFGIMQAKIADMYTALQSSRAFAYQVAREYDRGVRSRVDAASCLLHASEAAVKVTLETIQTLGGNGYINDYPAGRLLRDAKLYEIGAGTNEIRRMLIGRELFEGRF